MSNLSFKIPQIAIKQHFKLEQERLCFIALEKVTCIFVYTIYNGILEIHKRLVDVR